MSCDGSSRSPSTCFRRGFETLVLAPLAPLGAHRALAPVDQNKVVTTVRGNEVAADPTNALVLDAALRRRALRREDPRSSETVRLAAIQRVVRAQVMTGPGVQPHFQLLGLVSAGRDTGRHAFERRSATEHVTSHVETCLRAGADAVTVAVTDLSGGGMRDMEDELRSAFVSRPEVDVVAKERAFISGLGLERLLGVRRC
jgi:hypothetical protein